MIRSGRTIADEKIQQRPVAFRGKSAYQWSITFCDQTLESNERMEHLQFVYYLTKMMNHEKNLPMRTFQTGETDAIFRFSSFI